MVRHLLSVLVAIAVVAGARAGRAEDVEPTVIVISADATFEEALRDALLDRRVQRIGPAPSPTLAELGAQSRRLADRFAAVATVWLSPASAGATLVTYDRTADRFLVRELAYALPLTPTQADEAARMVRTMLRALRSEDDDAIARSAGGASKAALPVPEPPPHFGAGLGVGAWLASPEAYAAPQVTLALAWRPHGLGAAVAATFAPAADVESASFEGNVRDVVVAAEVRRALRVAPTVHVTPGLGAALHVLSFEGAFGAGPLLVSRRYNPALRVGLLTDVALPYALELGLGVSADCLLQRQRYEAGNERILIVPRVQLLMAAFIGVRL
jgi:hypothetical protein